MGGPYRGRGLFQTRPTPKLWGPPRPPGPPRCLLFGVPAVFSRVRVPMAGKLVSLVPPLLLAAVGLAGLLLLCVPTQDVREPPALKVHALTAALGSSWPRG